MGMRIATLFPIGLLSVQLAAFTSTCQKSNGEATKDPPSTTTQAADVTLDGIDTSALTPREKKEWSAYVSEFLSPCRDTPVPIAQCVKEKRSCSRCVSAAKYVLKGVRDGLPRDQIEKSYKNRFDPEKVKSVAIDESPAKGPESAAITLVEFADFECPHCGYMAPILEKAWEQNKGQVRMVYKFMPLAGHPHAEPSARAAIAAGKQGKFWEMHKKLFENQQHLEQSDIDVYAKDLGLDVGKLHADMQSKETTDRLARDRKLADQLEVKGTPTIFINGREFDPRQDLNEWFAQELAGGGGGGGDAPKAVASDKPAASGSAAPAVSASASGSAKPATSASAAPKASAAGPAK